MRLFRKHVFVNDSRAVKDTACIVTQIVTKALREHDETLKGISEAEIKSKDRVDISMEEYELLKKENAELRDRCMQAECILREMHIDPKVVERIIPDTVHRWESTSLRDFSTHIIIEFDVSDYDIRDI